MEIHSDRNGRVTSCANRIELRISPDPHSQYRPVSHPAPCYLSTNTLNETSHPYLRSPLRKRAITPLPNTFPPRSPDQRTPFIGQRHYTPANRAPETPDSRLSIEVAPTITLGNLPTFSPTSLNPKQEADPLSDRSKHPLSLPLSV